MSPALSPRQMTPEPSTKTPLKTDKAIRNPSKWRTMRKILIALGVIAVLAVGVVLALHFSKTKEFDELIAWIQTHQLIGSVVYVATFTLFIILCFPSTAFELLAGYIFGFWLGFILASVGKLLGSVLSFVIGRYLCRKRVKEYMERGHPVFKAFQSLLRKRQVLVVFLTRIAFFPIAMKNYGLSVLDVRFMVYFMAALITGIPFSIIWVYSGHAAQHLTTLLSDSKANHQTEVILLVVGAGSALLLLFFVGYYTRKHILAMAEEETAVEEQAATQENESAAMMEEDAAARVLREV
ncbi:hypothetical protein Poli38472_010106 [Pythium oligandrum]|uniref:VTT domain-containing protein n=1 Tax=Pythium oligandrum TaxID=41045 RepID=A0A8K1FGC2_PYTOL|nr:hypothetical protein Poli38472_010106 [Pythium oligandrum]|eukprot:TMW58547.1 hypothetical protein Poli38472_010106 [Pythium oligandrum]